MAFSPFSAFRQNQPQSPLMGLRQRPQWPTVIGNIGQPSGMGGPATAPLTPQQPMSLPPTPTPDPMFPNQPPMGAPDPFNPPNAPKALPQNPFPPRVNVLGQKPGAPMFPRTPARGPGGY